MSAPKESLSTERVAKLAEFVRASKWTLVDLLGATVQLGFGTLNHLVRARNFTDAQIDALNRRVDALYQALVDELEHAESDTLIEHLMAVLATLGLVVDAARETVAQGSSGPRTVQPGAEPDG